MANNQFEGVGIVSILLDTIGYFIGCGSERRERRKSKKRTYDPRTGMYIDQYGATRLYSDDSYVQVNRNEFGEIVIRYQDGTIRNLNQEEYDKAPGTVTKLAGYSHHEKAQYFRSAIGHRYKDRKTGDVYVIRRLKYNDDFYNFYMNASTGIIIRPTDGQVRIENEARKRNFRYNSDEDYNKMIDYFNNNIDDFDKSSFYRNQNNTVDYKIEDLEFYLKFRRTDR